MPLQKVLFWHKNWIYYMIMIFWSGTKTLKLAQYVNQFWVWQKSIWTSPKCFGTNKRTRHYFFEKKYFEMHLFSLQVLVLNQSWWSARTCWRSRQLGVLPAIMPTNCTCHYYYPKTYNYNCLWGLWSSKQRWFFKITLWF